MRFATSVLTAMVAALGLGGGGDAAAQDRLRRSIDGPVTREAVTRSLAVVPDEAGRPGGPSEVSLLLQRCPELLAAAQRGRRAQLQVWRRENGGRLASHATSPAQRSHPDAAIPRRLVHSQSDLSNRLSASFSCVGNDTPTNQAERSRVVASVPSLADRAKI